LSDFTKAIELNPEFSPAYINRGGCKYILYDVNGACSDWNKAAQLGNKEAEELKKKYCY
jgi:hypothetical protein